MTVVRGAAMVALGVTVVVLGVGLVVPACVLYSVVCCYGVCHCDFMSLGAYCNGTVFTAVICGAYYTDVPVMLSSATATLLGIEQPVIVV